jgi:hypothetical protein
LEKLITAQFGMKLNLEIRDNYGKLPIDYLEDGVENLDNDQE